MQSTSQFSAAESSPDNPLLQRLAKRMMGGFQLNDILHARHHSADFRETRADYIGKRLRFMLLFFVVAVPAWIPIDYLTLERQNFTVIAISRLILSVTLLLLLMLVRHKPGPRLISALLTATMVASVAFYLTAMITMATGITETPLAGYTALPLMMIALTGLFPVTILFGGALALFIVAGYLALQGWQGALLSTETWNTLWVLALVSGVTLWIQCGQLLMLLKLYRESTRDALTGLINRRVLMKQFELQVAEAQAHDTPFSVLMCDLDRFKRINDNYGHLMGDQVLKRAAGILQQQLRKEEVIARFGGEEFMVILPGLSSTAAMNLAEKVRNGFELCEVHDNDGNPIIVTTSIGLTEYIKGERIEELLERADQLLYRAKQQGRNQVVSATDRLAVLEKTA